MRGEGSWNERVADVSVEACEKKNLVDVAFAARWGGTGWGGVGVCGRGVGGRSGSGSGREGRWYGNGKSESEGRGRRRGRRRRRVMRCF